MAEPGDFGIEDTVLSFFEAFRSKAEGIAQQYGCTVDRLLYEDVAGKFPFLVPEREIAVNAAKSFADELALLGGKDVFGEHLSKFKLVKLNSYTGILGFNSAPIPKVCILQGVARFEPDLECYVPVVCIYSLQKAKD